MAFTLVATDVVVPLLEVVTHAREGGVDQSEAGDVNVVVFVRCQVEPLKILKNQNQPCTRRYHQPSF